MNAPATELPVPASPPPGVDTDPLLQMAEKIEDLPLLPQVLTRFMQLDQNADDFFEKFAALIQEDPALAVRVVAMANSSASSPVSPIVSIRDAMTRMGYRSIQTAVMSMAVQRVFTPTEPNQIRLWTHSIMVALATRRLAELVPTLQVDTGLAYLAGLLHDVGRFVMFQHAAPELNAVDECQWTSPDELVQADVAVYRYTHSELGYLACVRWALPEELAGIVRHHHDAISRPVERGTPLATQLCVQIADALSVAVLENDELDADDVSAVEKLVRSRCVEGKESRRWFEPKPIAQECGELRSEGLRIIKGMGLVVPAS